MSNVKRAFVVVASAMIGITGLQHAEAAEGGVLDYFPGAAGPFVGMFPPIPGVFLLNQVFVSPGGRLAGPDGKPSPLPITASGEGVIERLIVSYPGSVAGAHLYQQVILPLVNVSTRAFGARDSEFGVVNPIVSPFILKWALNPTSSVVVGLDVATGFGSFDRKRSLNVALDHTSVQPVVAYRYFDPEGLTVGASFRALFNTENSFDHYHNGTAFAVDFDAGYSIGNLRLGVTGGYAQQIEDDTQYGVRIPGGNRYRSLKIGPSVTYQAGPVTINVNYQFAAITENTVKSDTLWVNFAVPLYAVPPPASVVTK